MKVTLMACSGIPEVLWSAFRMGNLMLEKMDNVTIFLNGPSVGYASLASRDYPISELARGCCWPEASSWTSTVWGKAIISGPSRLTCTG